MSDLKPWRVEEDNVAGPGSSPTFWLQNDTHDIQIGTRADAEYLRDALNTHPGYKWETFEDWAETQYGKNPFREKHISPGAAWDASPRNEGGRGITPGHSSIGFRLVV